VSRDEEIRKVFAELLADGKIHYPEEAAAIVDNRRPSQHQSVPGRMTFSVLEKKGS
jgi:hypothetical protein